jgi:hypothetical protein
MDFNTMIELIIKDLDDACQIIDEFKSYPGVPSLHAELAKAKCRSAAGIMALLKKDTVAGSPQAGAAIKSPVPEDGNITEKEIMAEDKSPKAVSIIADNFADMPGVNERLGDRPAGGGSIGLNDKFFLIRELFSGDNNKYEQAVSRLEEATSLCEAKAIISEYAGAGTGNEASSLLIDIIKRKLNADE